MSSMIRLLLCSVGAVLAVLAAASPAWAAGAVLQPTGDDWVCVSVDAIGVGVCQGDPMPSATR